MRHAEATVFMAQAGDDKWGGGGGTWWKSSVTSRNRRGGHVAPATAASAAVGWLCSFCRCLLRCVMQVSLWEAGESVS